MTAVGARLVTAFLAAPPTPPPGKGAEWGKAAPIGLLVIVLLGIALFFLVKSMNRHMRKVTGRTSFDDEGAKETRGAESVATGAPEEPTSRTDSSADPDPRP